MYKQTKNIKNLVERFLARRKKYSKFSSKLQDLIIDAVLADKQLVYIEDVPDFFLESAKITDVINCIVIQLNVSACWEYIEKNEEFYRMIVKFYYQKFEF